MSSTAELKTLMFSEEYRPAGLLYWLVTTLEPNPENGRALLLWLVPMLFASWEFGKTGRTRQLQRFLWGTEQECKCTTQAFVNSCWRTHAVAQTGHDDHCATFFLFFDWASTCLDMRLKWWASQKWRNIRRERKKKKTSLIVWLYKRLTSGNTEAQELRRHCLRQCHPIWMTLDFQLYSKSVHVCRQAMVLKSDMLSVCVEIKAGLAHAANMGHWNASQ